MYFTSATKELLRQFGKPGYVCRYRSGVVSDFSNIPTPKGLPVIGTRVAIWAAGSSEKLHEYVDRRHKELGPIYRERLGPVTGIFISDPQSIRSIFAQEGKYPVHIIPQSWIVFNEKHGYTRGLLFMNGEEWWEHRKIMNKLLLKGNLKWIEECCDYVIENFVRDLRQNISSRQNEVLEDKLYRIFLDVLVSLLMGRENYVKHQGIIEPFMRNLGIHVKSVFETTVKLQMLPSDWAAKLRLPSWTAFEFSMKNALLSANALVDVLSKKCDSGDGLLKQMATENISEHHTKAIVADLVLGAADTTTYTMEWLLYLVAKHTAVQEKIRKECVNPNSNYPKYVLRETLRLYPVAPFITRFLPQELQIAGYKIPSNSLIVMSIYTTGRDDKYFQNAKEFNPERWERRNDNLLVKEASLPFAMGSRSCVGRKLAEYELQKMLTEIVRNFHLKLCNINEIKMVLRMISVPSEPISLKMKKIN